MTKPSPVICIVDDDTAVRDSLCAVLGAWGYETITFSTAEAFLAAKSAHGSDCILLDVRLPGQDGLELLAAVRKVDKHIPVIILTGHGDVTMAVRALKDGAQDFIEKPYAAEDLVSRIDAVIQNAATQPADNAHYIDVLKSLTPREMQVMRMVVAGHSNKVIAYKLDLSPKTVEIHRGRVMKKTESRSLSYLVRLALKAGVDPYLEDQTPDPQV